MYRSENYPETLGTSYKSGSVHDPLSTIMPFSEKFSGGEKREKHAIAI